MATSSARYTDLYSYTRTAEQIDHDLLGQAGRLISRLSYFEATCREPGFALSSDGLGNALQSYGTRALPIDQKVRRVGEGFERADRVPFTGRVRLWWSRTDWRQLLKAALWPQVRTASLLGGVPAWLSRSGQSIRDGLVRAANVAQGLLPDSASDSLSLTDSLLSLAAISAMRASISSIPGRVGISAPAWSRKIAEVSLRHGNRATALKQLVKPNFGVLFLAAAALKTWEQSKVNAAEYGDNRYLKWTANAYDGAMILTVSAMTAVLAYGATLAVAALLPVATPVILIGAIGVGIGIGLGYAIDRWILDPYLKSDWHKEHVQILHDNLKWMGGGISDFAGRARDSVTSMVTPAATQLRDHTDKLVNFIMGDPELPPACIPL